METVRSHARWVFSATEIDRLAADFQSIRGKSLASTNGSYCIIEGPIGYVQFMGDIGEGEEFLCEIQSHHFFQRVEQRLTDSVVSLIIGCGFQWPAGEQNFARWFFVRNDEEVSQLAEFALGILDQIFGPGTNFTVKTHIAQPKRAES